MLYRMATWSETDKPHPNFKRWLGLNNLPIAVLVLLVIFSSPSISNFNWTFPKIQGTAILGIASYKGYGLY